MLASRMIASRVAGGYEPLAVAASIAAEVAVLTGILSGVERLVTRLTNPSRFKVAFLGVTPRDVADMVGACGAQATRFLGSRQGVVCVIVEGLRQREFESRLRSVNPLMATHMVRLGRA